MIKIIRRVRIPRLSKVGLDELELRQSDTIKWSEVVDIDLTESDACVNAEVDGARQKLIIDARNFIQPADVSARFKCGMNRDAGSLLLFRDVSRHIDAGNPFKLVSRKQPSRTVSSASLGIVLRGTCLVHLHKGYKITKSVELRAGDVYVLDQSVEHSVSGATKICAHLSIAVRLKDAQRAASHNA